MASYYSIYKTQNLVSWNYSRCIHKHTNTHTQQGEISFLFRLLKSKFLNMLRSLSSKSTDLTPANENRVSLDDDGRFLNGCGGARKAEAIGREADDPHLQWAAPAGVLLLDLHLLERHSWTCKATSPLHLSERNSWTCKATSPLYLPGRCSWTHQVTSALHLSERCRCTHKATSLLHLSERNGWTHKIMSFCFC